MTLYRRDILAAGAGLAAVSLYGGVQAAAFESKFRMPSETLLLFSESVRNTALAAQLRRDAPFGHSVEQIVSAMTHDGFVTTSTLLEQASGYRIVALLDDADVMVIDSLLARRAVHNRRQQRITAPGATSIGPVLLTARL